ncbi:hypothetical protein CBP51_18720 [Cellvibrio mixtus]|uniref:Uncharacterized protein n=1 Tax=Cellvibrio mixtus TaxID=39650 RepID=A0A266Q393_9GAMM|nr:hypothetical protein CBP51_18720 [Cellvibrio mixtus]
MGHVEIAPASGQCLGGKYQLSGRNKNTIGNLITNTLVTRFIVFAVLGFLRILLMRASVTRQCLIT